MVSKPYYGDSGRRFKKIKVDLGLNLESSFGITRPRYATFLVPNGTDVARMSSPFYINVASMSGPQFH